MISEVIRLWLRYDDNGQFKLKIYKQLHAIKNIERNESPKQSYSKLLEYNHVDLKELSRRIQCIKQIHNKKLANRICESYMINYCFNKIHFTVNMS